MIVDKWSRTFIDSSSYASPPFFSSLATVNAISSSKSAGMAFAEGVFYALVTVVRWIEAFDVNAYVG